MIKRGLFLHFVLEHSKFPVKFILRNPTSFFLKNDDDDDDDDIKDERPL